MSTNRRKRVVEKLGEKAYREAFVAEHIDSGVAFQVHALREKLGLSQTELAKRAGMHQSQISKLENPDDEDGVNLGTLQRLAAAFDVALSVRFVSFGDLVEWETNLGEEALAPPVFADDPKLNEGRLASPKQTSREDHTSFVRIVPKHGGFPSKRTRSREPIEITDTTALSALWLR